MLNLQLAEKAVSSADGSVEVVDIFETIQGEGPFAGSPSVFVRTAGCNLQCPLCDTDYTANRRMLSPAQILTEVRGLRHSGLVVLTGGEPLRQPVGRLIWLLLNSNYQVQIETNGTLFSDSLDDDNKLRPLGLTIVCCPKTGAVNPKLHSWIDHYKYVIQAGKVDPADGLPTDSLNFGVRPARPPVGFRGKIYCQPCDEQDDAKNGANMAAAVASCLKYGYQLCVQIHKIARLP